MLLGKFFALGVVGIIAVNVVIVCVFLIKSMRGCVDKVCDSVVKVTATKHNESPRSEQIVNTVSHSEIAVRPEQAVNTVSKSEPPHIADNVIDVDAKEVEPVARKISSKERKRSTAQLTDWAKYDAPAFRRRMAAT